MDCIRIGELMLMPTSTTYIANLAPADMRRHAWRWRYMSIYGLTWGVAESSRRASFIGALIFRELWASAR